MRILHTSDWHLMDTIGNRRVPRRSDINHSLEQINNYLIEGDVDVMIVAGDLFRELSMRPEEVKESLSDMHRIFMPFFERGGSIIATLGNHDREVFFEMMKTVLDMVKSISEPNGGVTNTTGRIYFAPQAQVLKLKDKKGEIVQFVLMPYPTGVYLKGEQGRNFKDMKERNRAIQATFRDVLNKIKNEKIDNSLPSILVSHLHIIGTELHGKYRLSEAENVMFGQNDIPTGWCYAALGHIHQAQAPVDGAPHVRYSGSIERLDYGEREDKKSVVLFEIGQNNKLVKTPEILPIEASSFLNVEITDPKNEIDHLHEKYPGADNSLVKYKLHWDPHEDNKAELCRAIERIFPRWYAFECIAVGSDYESNVLLNSEKLRDVSTVVREYLGIQLKNNPYKEELFKLADELLAEEVSEQEVTL